MTTREAILTSEGRSYAERHPSSLVCRVALRGFSASFPEAKVSLRDAIRACNRAGKEGH